MPKCTCGWGYAPDPAKGAHDAPPGPIVGWGGGYPPHTPPHLGLQFTPVVVLVESKKILKLYYVKTIE